MSDIHLKEIKVLAEELKGWNCKDAWLDTLEDSSCAVVGNIDEDGNLYPVLTVDCGQYFAEKDSLKLAKFYAQVTPKLILSIANSFESQQAEIQRLNEVIELMEQNEVYLHNDYNDKLARFGNPKIGSIYCTVGNYDYQLQVLYAYPTEHGMSIKVDAIKEITRLTAIIAENEADKWISVEDRLPDYQSVTQKRLRVLVFWKDTNAVFALWYGARFGYAKASFYEENDWDESDDGQIDEGDNFLFGDTLTFKNITHWQPLPQPPAMRVKGEHNE